MKTLSLGLVLFTIACSHLHGADRPNVILIMTDDQGYGDLSITDNEIVETPNMDRIGREGVWLKHFYVSPVCTPTRANLMTGRYNYRTRAIDTYLGRAVMEPDEVTIAEALSEAGYATGIFGKWHLGDNYPTRTIDQGFTESVVHCGGGLRQPANPPEGERYHDPILFHNGQPKLYEGFCTDIFFDEAAKFIESKAKADKPFFVYLPTNAPHGPFDEPPTRELFEQFRARLPNDDKPTRAAFYAMIKNVDNNIGRLLNTLEETGIDKETIVIFLTDNGPAGGGTAKPFRGAKGQTYEGGIRTVCFLRWPGHIEAGSEVNFTTAHIDLMPTILDFCGVENPKGVKLDGRSARPLIPEKDTLKTQGWPDRHLFLQWHRGNVPQRYYRFAAIDPQGRWKLLSMTNPNGRGSKNEPQFELYDLVNDRSETTNVAGQHPEIVSQLKAEYDKWFDDVTHTRDPNFGMPPIVIGAKQQSTVVLTPQDKRVEDGDSKGWWTPGYWPVDIVKPGPFTIHVRLTSEVRNEATVRLSLEGSDQPWEQTISIPRGVHSGAIGNVEFPSTGQGRIVATVEGARDSINVYQVTVIE